MFEANIIIKEFYFLKNYGFKVAQKFKDNFATIVVYSMEDFKLNIIYYFVRKDHFEFILEWSNTSKNIIQIIGYDIYKEQLDKIRRQYYNNCNFNNKKIFIKIYAKLIEQNIMVLIQYIQSRRPLGYDWKGNDGY